MGFSEFAALSQEASRFGIIPHQDYLPAHLPMLKSIHSPDQQVLCSLLRDERKKAGYSQNVLAQKLNKPQSFVAKVEKGERRLDLLEFLTISEALGIDPLKFVRKLQKLLTAK